MCPLNKPLVPPKADPPELTQKPSRQAFLEYAEIGAAYFGAAAGVAVSAVRANRQGKAQLRA